MKLWDAFVLFMFFLFAVTGWWAYGALAGIVGLVVTGALTFNLVRAERAKKRVDLAHRREIEETGYTWEFFQEWCKSEDEIERRESRRAVRALMMRLLRFVLRPFSTCF